MRSAPTIAPVRLHRDADCNANARVALVVEVVAVVDIADVDLVVVVPVVTPVGRPRVNDAQPVAVVLETRIAANHHERQALDPEPMIRSEIPAEAVVGNPIAVISAALLPGAMIRLPVCCPMLLPGSLLHTPLIRTLPWSGSASLLLGVFLLFADWPALLLPGLGLSPLRRVIGTLLLRGWLTLQLGWLTLRLLRPRRWPLLLLLVLLSRLSLLVWAVLFWMIFVVCGPLLGRTRKNDQSQK